MNQYRQHTQHGTLPNLIVIGAQKCATTSLHYYFELHPQIAMSREKELNFFVVEQNWSKGLAWYTAQFTGKAAIHGEVSPNYTNYPFFAGVPERMHAVVPNAKLIYLVRDPIERIISQYVHRFAAGLEERPLAEALAPFESSLYVQRSRYYTQLAQYFPYFPSSNILLVTHQELYAYRQQTLQKVFRFLGVDPTFFSSRFFHLKHLSSAKRRKTRVGQWVERLPGMHWVERLPFRPRERVKYVLYFPLSQKVQRPILDPAQRAELIDYLKEDITRLRCCTGRAFADWCL